MNKEQENQFKENIKEIARLELKNSFNNNLMETLNSAFIFKYVDTLEKQSQKYKEVIDKIDKYINDYNVFEVFSFPLMKRWEEEQAKSSIDYEFKTSLIKDLKDILKEVE